MTRLGPARAAVALAALLGALAAGCEQDVVLGGAGGGFGTASTSASATDCAGKRCGASCIIEGCDGRAGCITPAAAGYCSDGACQLTEPVCTPYVACDAASACGDSCWPCDLSRSDCNPQGQAYTCTETKKCLPGKADCSCVGLGCPPKLPCEDQACGAPCACDPDQSAGGCPEGSTSPRFCDGSGNCLPLEILACPQGYKPCENKNCGQGCSPCKPGTDCEATGDFVCNSIGECTLAGVSCFKQCTAARCGEACSPCDPNSPSCTVPESAFCDKYGSCRVGAASYCPCDGAACGDACAFCDPADPSTCSPSELRDHVCDAAGACVNLSSAPACRP